MEEESMNMLPNTLIYSNSKLFRQRALRDDF